MKSVFRWAFMAILISALFAPVVHAQPAAQTGKLIVTVVDPSRLVIPGATVAVVGLEVATKKLVIPPVKSSDKGEAVFDKLPLGRYAVAGEFSGFGIGAIKELRLKTGDNKHVLVLPLATMTESITVERDRQAAAADRGATFGSAMTREQIDALSEDPDEMARQLQDIAGPGATIRVDSFEGAQLPPKAMIKAIHITRDQFAAENHSAGMMFLDIITQPGVRPLSAGARVSFYDSALDGRNPLVPKKGPAQTQNYSVNVGGTLIKNRSGFGLSVYQTRGYTTPNIYAATLAGTQAQNVNLHVTNDFFMVSGNVDYALTKDQTLRVGFNGGTNTSANQGVGAYDLIERAFSMNGNNFNLRVQEAGPLGRRFFINTRFSMNRSDSNTTSAVEAPTVSVIGAFTGGGAQQSGGRHTRTYSLQSDLDYVRNIHSVRLGISLDGGTYRSNDWSNYLGTYTFDSLTSYQAGLPLAFTRRLGDPNIAYDNWQAGFYAQDDIRVSKSLTISPGVRVEAQTHLKDHNNIGPRLGVTWAPFKSGRTTLRASFGQFYDWLSSGTYEQTLRVDGIHQQEVNIFDPSYPIDPTAPGVIPPTNKYLLAGDLQMAQNTRLSLGVDQQLAKAVRFNAIYSDTHARGSLVGQNLNAPVDGVRPVPALANEIEAVSEGRSRSRALTTYTMLDLAPKGQPGNSATVMLGGGGMMMMSSGGGGTTGSLFSLRRGLSLNVGYTLAKSENNVDGAFSVSPTGSLATEWGPSNFDVRHRVSIGMNSGAFRNLSISAYVSASSAAPYTIRTGHDDNGDLILNDRPASVGRNTERGSGQWNSYAYLTYNIGIGHKPASSSGGIDIATIARAAGISMPQMAAPTTVPKYRLSFSVTINNLANHANYGSYNGIMTSPLFGKPTLVQGVRSFNTAASFGF